MHVVLKDGEPLSTLSTVVDVTSPMWMSGQSLFETMRVHPSGVTGLFRLTDHLERLTLAARRLEWRECPSIELLDGWVRRAAQLYRAKAATDGRLRLTVAWTRPGGPPETIVVVTPYIPVQRPAEVVTTPVMIPWTGDAIAKMGSRFLYAVAEARARAQGADEALLIDREGRPVEGARSNLFVAVPGGVITPPLDAGPLAGIARRTLLDLARREGLEVEERPLAWEDLAAGAPFLTNALWGVRAVSSVDGRPCSGPEEIVLRLKDAYEREVHRCLDCS